MRICLVHGVYLEGDQGTESKVKQEGKAKRVCRSKLYHGQQGLSLAEECQKNILQLSLQRREAEAFIHQLTPTFL